MTFSEIATDEARDAWRRHDSWWARFVGLFRPRVQVMWPAITRLNTVLRDLEPEFWSTVRELPPSEACRRIAARYGATDYRGDMLPNQAAECLLRAFWRAFDKHEVPDVEPEADLQRAAAEIQTRLA